MAAASFLVPGLSGWSAKPKRFRPPPRANLRRRERLTPPYLIGDSVNPTSRPSELEIVQERHIKQKISEYLKPFALFLKAIGRFPYCIDGKTVSKKQSSIMAIQKASCGPILDSGNFKVCYKLFFNNSIF